MPPPRSSESRANESLQKPFGHFRLTAFFVLVAAGVSLFALWRAREHGSDFTPTQAGWLAVTSVCLCAAIGFAGVFFHRLRINPVRWRETEKHMATIRRESAKYRVLMEGAADLLLVVEPEGGSVREAGARAKEAFALRDGTLASIRACVTGEDAERLMSALVRAAASPDARESLEGLRIATASGVRIADARLAAVDVEEERLVQVALRDVTQQKEMERSLRVHERLSSIGLLTAGVAHEINNPLEGIGNYLKLLERTDLAPETRARYLDLVRHGFARIGEIVRDLLRFARPQPKSGMADLGAAANRAAKLAAYTDKLRNVSIAFEGLDAPLLVQGDEGRLEQVLVNLFLNAGAAMAGRGSIQVRARKVGSASDGANEVEITVDDDGPGIPLGDLARIFDPFFTTSSGTGLGLSVSYGIVAAHGGRIWAENKTGGGARFTIRLPSKGETP